MAFFSTAVTPDVTPQNLMINRQGLTKASQITIVIRSMGTATYVAFGGIDSQDRRYTIAGDGFSLSGEKVDEKGTKYLNPSELFVISDTNDAVIEVLGEAL